jgi:hypothetical protein
LSSACTLDRRDHSDAGPDLPVPLHSSISEPARFAPRRVTAEKRKTRSPLRESGPFAVQCLMTRAGSYSRIFETSATILSTDFSSSSSLPKA